LKFTSLKHLEFSDPVDIEEHDWDSVRKLTNLTTLSISEKATRRASAFSSTHLRPLEHLPFLTNITITGCNRISNLDALKNSIKLQYLNLSNTKIDDDSISIISGLPLLSHVLIEENDITDKCLVYFSNLKQLKQLDVNGCKGITYTQETIKNVISNKNFMFLHGK